MRLAVEGELDSLGLDGLLVHHGAWLHVIEKLAGFDLDDGIAPEELQQNAHSILTIEHGLDDAGEAAHGAFGKFDVVAHFQRGLHLAHIGIKHLGADILNDLMRDGDEDAAELQHADHVIGRLHSTERLSGVEPGEEVGGEERLDEPNLAPRSAALKFDARAIGLDAEL